MSDDLLEQIQGDAYGVLSTTPGLSLAKVHLDNDGDIEAKVQRSLSVLEGAEGKLGLAVVVLLPEVVSAERELPGPPLRVRQEVQVIELVHYNRDETTGTGVRSSVAALRVLGALHLQGIGGRTLYAEKDPITPIKMKKGYVSHVVTVWARASGVSGPGRTEEVVPVWNDGDGTLSLSCGTAGAAIYYTTDGTHPRDGNGTLYSAAIAGLEVGDMVRAAAYASGLNPGDILELTVSN